MPDLKDIILKLSSSKGVLDYSDFETQLSECGCDRAVISRIFREVSCTNPFMNFSDRDYARFFDVGSNDKNRQDILDSLARAKAAVKKARASSVKVLVAAMPKSGSTFFTHCLAKALKASVTSLMTAQINEISKSGINGCFQELDEWALILKSLILHRGFVAQHHIQGTVYSENLLKSYGIERFVLFRNIFDGLVSADDMIMQQPGWTHWALQGTIKIPKDFTSLDETERLRIRGYRYLPWCIDFYLSYKRLEKNGAMINWVRYESDIAGLKTGESNLAENIAHMLGLNEGQAQSVLEAFNVDVSKKDSSMRYNKGVVGRGSKVPEELVHLAVSYCKVYGEELDGVDFANLLGQDIAEAYGLNK